MPWREGTPSSRASADATRGVGCAAQEPRRRHHHHHHSRHVDGRPHRGPNYETGGKELFMMRAGRGLGPVMVLLALLANPGVPLREALSHASNAGFFVPQAVQSCAPRHFARGRRIAREERPTLAARRRPARLELRAGLRDVVTNLWPFKRSEEDQYRDRKDVWNSLVMLDQVTGGELQVIVDALTVTGLWKELSAEGTDNKNRKPVTLFASLNSAFTRLPPDCLMADCVAALEGPAPMKPALLDELRSSLLGSIADGRYSVSALDGKKTAITTRCGRSANFDLMPGTRASDFTDYVLDVELRRKVKICSASALVSTDIQCSNGVIHIVDKLPDGSVPIVRLFSSSAMPPQKNMTESAANKLQATLYAARERKAELEAELAVLKPLVAEKKLNRESIKELVDTYSRQAADFDSYKIRAEEDLKRGNESAAAEILDSLFKVLDTFEMAEQGIKPDTPGEEEIHARYQYVNQRLLTLLEEQGVHRVEALGKPFDAREHEAVQLQESMEYEDQVVCKQYQRGYRIGGRLVRAALVVVSSGPGPASPPRPEDKRAEGDVTSTSTATGAADDSGAAGEGVGKESATGVGGPGA